MNRFKNKKGIALLYVIVVIGVLSLAFVSVTEIGKSRAMQTITTQNKNNAYEALDAMMECAFRYDRINNATWPGSGYTCNGNTVSYTSGTNGSFKYRMLTGMIDATVGTCAQAIIYYDLNGSTLGSQGSQSMMFARGFSSCRQSGGAMVAPLATDPYFSAVMERVKYKDFPHS